MARAVSCQCIKDCTVGATKPLELRELCLGGVVGAGGLPLQLTKCPFTTLELFPLVVWSLVALVKDLKCRYVSTHRKGKEVLRLKLTR